MSDELELEVFKAGNYGAKGNWGEAELDRMAAGYDPALHEAPVTVDHAQSGPALGWVAGLRRVGDRLVARLRGVSERLLELIRTGAFKKRSVEIYPAMKETGEPYLKAVSFLGAAAPEVKGLVDPQFEAKAESIQFEADYDHDYDYDYDYEKKEGEMMVKFNELREMLQAGGRWRPAWGKNGIKEFWRALASVDEIAVGENETIDAAGWFAQFLTEMPPFVAMGETAPARRETAAEMTPGGNVDADSLALHRRATAFMEENSGTPYGEALRAVAR